MDVERISRFFSALGSKSRLEIILELLEDSKCHTDLSSCIGKNVSTVWRHVKVLEDAGIVRSYKLGKTVVVEVVDPASMKTLLDLAQKIVSEKGRT